MSGPTRPSGGLRPGEAARIAARMTQGQNERLVLKLPPATKRAIKGRAAGLGITAAAYLVRLARRDGLDVPEMAGDDGGNGDN